MRSISVLKPWKPPWDFQGGGGTVCFVSENVNESRTCYSFSVYEAVHRLMIGSRDLKEREFRADGPLSQQRTSELKSKSKQLSKTCLTHEPHEPDCKVGPKFESRSFILCRESAKTPGYSDCQSYSSIGGYNVYLGPKIDRG